MDQTKFSSLAYIPGIVPEKPEPLARFMPPVPDGIVSTWLDNHIPQGSWILDPFCASPRLDIEAARAGYKLLVTANNPITRFLLEMAAIQPSGEELRSALSDLAASYKADDRIEPHIRALYNTLCARCGQVVSADAFIWEHGNPSPHTRIYTCPACGDTGEHPCTPYDAEQAGRLSSSGMHKARALERVIASTDQDRMHVEQALSVYPPRALYALITIINKLDGLSISPTGRKYLSALLLHAFDQANAMWKVPSSRERWRQLTIPRQYRENNIWLALEQGIGLYQAESTHALTTPVPLTLWPASPPEEGGICLYEGRLASIADHLPDLNIKSVCTTIPRPNQAFWTLSALWAGWLWGRESVGSIKSVLHRQRYDWGWHTSALTSVFKQLTSVLDPATPILGLVSEAELGFLASAMVAAKIAGCGLEGVAIRPEEDQAQIVWRSKATPRQLEFRHPLTDSGVLSATEYLESRGEPDCYFNTFTAALLKITEQWNSDLDRQLIDKKIAIDKQWKTGEAADQSEPTPSLVYSTIYNTAREALTYRSGFLRINVLEIGEVDTSNKGEAVQETLFSPNVGKSMIDEENESHIPELTIEEAELEAEKERPTRSSDISKSILLWLRDAQDASHVTSSDHYEQALVEFLSTHPDCTDENVNRMMCSMFLGLFTPDPEFIRLCLESYGERQENEVEHWRLRDEDQLSERLKDLENAKDCVRQIGDRLGIESIDQSVLPGKPKMIWTDKNGQLDYTFIPTISAAIGETVLYNHLSSTRGFIVLPGSRANLVVYKLRRDPRLNRAFTPSQGNWGFLKFRHLRSLVENPLLNRQNLDQLLGLDPLTYSTPQLRML